MNKVRVKQMVAVIGLLLAAVLTAPLLGRLGGVVEQAESGADPAAALTPLDVPVDADLIEWISDAPLPRRLEPGTRDAVGEAYLLSMAILDGSVPVAGADLAVHLTGPALAAARQANDPAHTLDRRHQLQAVFYSADGQLIEIEDVATRVVALDSGRAVVQTERAVAVLVSIDGVWHLRHRIVSDATSNLMNVSP